MSGARYLLPPLLTFQTVAHIVSLHAARRGPDPFSLSLAVLFSEIVKLVFWTCWAGLRAGPGAVLAFYEGAFSDELDQLLQLAVPALLYVLQTVLLQFSLGHLDPVTFQLASQVKIPTTAVCTVWMLGRHLSARHWAALCLLTVGVAMVSVTGAKSDPAKKEGMILGFGSVLLGSITSGFVGVYLEKIFKSRPTLPSSEKIPSATDSEIDHTTATNLRLSICGAVLALFSSLPLFSDFSVHLAKFTPLAWLTVLNTSLGGVLVALTIRYLDNIAKAMAMAMSVVIAGMIDSDGVKVEDPIWVAGAAAVVGSVGWWCLL